MIDILVPVLGRPHAVEPLVRSIHEHTTVPFRIRFICTLGDDEQINACIYSGEVTQIISRDVLSEYPRKMNLAYLDTEGEWVFLAADDLEFRRGWDVEALRVAGSGAHVIATNDLANAMVKKGRFGTHNLIRRSYVEEQGASADGPGVLVHEGYDHNFCDREICHLAQQRGVYAFAARSHVYHRHPNWRTAQMDDTYVKGASSFAMDQRLFLSRAPLWGSVGLSAGEGRGIRHTRSRGRRGR